MIRIATVACALLATTAAHSKCTPTRENTAACVDDVVHLCLSEYQSGGVPKAIVCLQRNRKSLSHDCSATLARCDGSAPIKFLTVPRHH